MRVLLDESVPRDLAREFSGHEVKTVVQMGWAGISNGELLQRAGQHFDVFVTTDQGIEHEQNLQEVGVGIVVLYGHTNRMADLLPLVPAILDSLRSIAPGELRRIGA